MPHPATGLTLDVDARRAGQRIVDVRAVIPILQPGQTLRLRHVRYLPGCHGPYGEVSHLAGLEVRAGARRLAWRRAADEVRAIEVDVPADVDEVELSYQWLGGQPGAYYPTPIDERLLAIQWANLVLYPQGQPAHALVVNARLRLPDLAPGLPSAPAMGWASALAGSVDADGWIRFAPTDLATLVDSPVYAGRHHQAYALDADGAAGPATLHLFQGADAARPDARQLAAHRAVFTQAERLFGPRPWARYALLVANLKGLEQDALEHFESSEFSYTGGYLDAWDQAERNRSDVAHEVVHVWNGKWLRPAGLVPDDFHSPVDPGLLWVYEGLTQYWGWVLSVRAGMCTAEQFRHDLATSAAWFDALPGRRWRSLRDTLEDRRMGLPDSELWPSWTRGSDYYDEAALAIWLAADLQIREASAGQRSLDDFAAGFFAPAANARQVQTYTLADVLAGLHAVWPHDWDGFVRQRLDATDQGPGLAATLARAGWRLSLEDSASALLQAEMDDDGVLDLTHSLGAAVRANGKLDLVHWGSPAFDAGWAPGDRLVGIGDLAYAPAALEQALIANRDGAAPLKVLWKRAGTLRHALLDVRGGPRHPRLRRMTARRDWLGEILQPAGTA